MTGGLSSNIMFCVTTKCVNITTVNMFFFFLENMSSGILQANF